MSLVTGYVDRIIFSKMEQINDKKFRVIFDNQILWNHKSQKVVQTHHFLHILALFSLVTCSFTNACKYLKQLSEKILSSHFLMIWDLKIDLIRQE